MGLNSTPLAERIHIGFFGRTNAGKSSLINAVTNQQLSIVSDIKGTTTDPVYKSMEILPLGPVTLIDTPGFDDNSALGELRINKTKQILAKIDIAVLVVSADKGISAPDETLINIFKEKNIDFIIVFNKADLITIPKEINKNEIYVSSVNNTNINELKNMLASYNKKDFNNRKLVSDLVNKDEFVVLVTPIDSAAPKGRLILPQQQVIRDLLEANAVTLVVKETELKSALNSCIKQPKLVITDSQAFKKVNAETPKDILLTSFSILFARYKGVLEPAVKGVRSLENIQNGDTILISEGCTHHRQCDDIGTVKLPNWIKNYTKKDINFEFSSGGSFPEDLSKYKMIIHCGGCMLKEQEVLTRYQQALEHNVSISNYGITIAYIHGILKRSIEIFPDLHKLL